MCLFYKSKTAAATAPKIPAAELPRLDEEAAPVYGWALVVPEPDDVVELPLEEEELEPLEEDPLEEEPPVADELDPVAVAVPLV